MRNLKKVLSMVLCVAMMLSVMVVGTGAAFADQNKITHTEAVDMAVALKIIDGKENNKFDPTGNVTRAEMCKMICVALNGGEAPILGSASATTFTDTKGHWAAAYIESCVTQGIVSGVTPTTFEPDASVTPTQAAKMLLVALGFNAKTESYVGNSWSVNVNVRASERGLYKDLKGIETDKAMTRDNAAQMIYNALNANMVEYDYQISTGANGQIVTKAVLKDKTTKDGKKITFLDDKYGSNTYEGQMESFTYKSSKGEWTYTINLDDGSGKVAVTSKTDYTDLLGMKVKAVADTDKVAFGIVANDSSILLEGLVGDMPTLKADDDSMKIDGVTYKFDNGTVNEVKVYEFTAAKWDTAHTAYTNLFDMTKTGETKSDEFEFVAIDNDDDGKIDFIRVLPYTVQKVTYASSTKFTTGGQSYTIADVNVYDGIKKDDYVAFVKDVNTADDTDTFVKAEKISGKITSVDDRDVKIGDTWYTIDNAYKKTGDVPDAGTTMTDAVVVNGYIFDADATNTKAVSDYAVVMGTSTSGVNGNQVKLLFSDGTKKVVDADKNYVDDGKGTPTATEMPIGTLVTYKTNSDSEYILTKAGTADTGFDLTAQGVTTGTPDINNVTVSKISNSSDKAGYIKGIGKDSSGKATTATATIADDAVIFVQYEETSYKVITGAQMKKMASGDFKKDYEDNYMLASKTNNTYNVDMAYVSIGDKNVNDADTYYGYITSVKSIQNADTDIVKQVTMQTKDGVKTYQTSATSIKNDGELEKRNAVEFKLNSDGEINEVVAGWDVDNTLNTGVDGITNVTASADGYATVGISSIGSTLQFQAKGSKVLTTQVDVGSGVMKYLELDSDTVYLYIENTDAEAHDKVDISTADDHAKNTGELQPNAFVVWDKDGDVVLVVYDVDNDIIQ